MPTTTADSSTSAVAEVLSRATSAIKMAATRSKEAASTVVTQARGRAPESVRARAQQAYGKSVAAIKSKYGELPPAKQRVVLLAATVTATLVVSHFAHEWWYRRKTTRAHRHYGLVNGGGGKDGDKTNESNTIYESEVSARQYMEFHYTPSKLTYVQRLRNIQESFDFPVRIISKFRIYNPRTTAFLSVYRQSGNASASTPNAQQKTKADAAAAPKKRRALDVGCATGASVFEMSKYFDEVIGIDYSEVFVHLANEVKSKSLKRPAGEATPGQPLNVAANSEEAIVVTSATTAAAASRSKKESAWTVPYTAPVQGENTQSRELVLSPGVFPERCFFYCGDAMDMFVRHDSGFSPSKGYRSKVYEDVSYWKAPLLLGPTAAKASTEHSPTTVEELLAEVERQSAEDVDVDDERFDAVLCSNLIDRVPEPRKLLASFAILVKKGGVLLLCDPYSWWEGATKKSQWIGGRSGVSSEDEVKRLLSGHFELLSESEEPFLIRDHIRHYQLGFSHCTVWRRR